MNKVNVECARVKLQRAISSGNGVDPASGYTTEEIIQYLRRGADDPETTPDVAAAACACIRRHSLPTGHREFGPPGYSISLIAPPRRPMC
jgi:hypothetical protein